MVRERNAALSQVLFGPHAATCLTTILGPNAGAKDSGSGEAGGEIMRGLVQWMKAHSGEIKALDLDRPLLPQADRLTNDQVFAAFRSMDPLANLPKAPHFGYSTQRD